MDARDMVKPRRVKSRERGVEAASRALRTPFDLELRSLSFAESFIWTLNSRALQRVG